VYRGVCANNTEGTRQNNSVTSGYRGLKCKIKKWEKATVY